MKLERLSIELTNQCQKACWFCYNHSQPAGATEWQVDEVVRLVTDCSRHGTRAVSFGGGEPLQYHGLFEILDSLKGVSFRSITTNGMLLDDNFEKLTAACPDKVHVSIHFPQNESEVSRVARQVRQLADAGVRSGVNLLVSRSNLPAATRAAQRLYEMQISNDRIVFLPMRGFDTPQPGEVAQVAGNKPFQSMSCLAACARSPRFCSIGWDKSVAWCSYTESRRKLPNLSYNGLVDILRDLPLVFCGGRDE